MFGQNLPISAAFTDIENEATTVQRNRCVHTLSQTQHWPASDVTKRGYKNKWRCVVLKKKTTNRIGVKRWNMVWLAVNLSSSALRRFCISYVCPCEWPPWRNKTNVQRQVEACSFGTVPSVGNLTNTSTLGNTAIRRFCTSYASKVRRVHTCDNFQP